MSTPIWSGFESIFLSEVCAHDKYTANTKLYNDIAYLPSRHSVLTTNHKMCFEKKHMGKSNTNSNL